MIVLQHLFVGSKVYFKRKHGHLYGNLTEFVVVLGEFSIAESAVLVHNPAHFYYPRESVGVTPELDDLHFLLYNIK